jgi:hypothetical protein
MGRSLSGSRPKKRLALRDAGAKLLAVDETLIYREEVTAVLIALSDVVTLLTEIKEVLIDGEEEEEDDR